jgi:uncharacterized membrane protein
MEVIAAVVSGLDFVRIGLHVLPGIQKVFKVIHKLFDKIRLEIFGCLTNVIIILSSFWAVTADARERIRTECFWVLLNELCSK